MNASQRIPLLSTLVAAVIAAGNIGCGGGAAVVATQLAVSVSTANATAGMPVNVSVRALDASSALATTYAGTVHFTSSDAQATLPADSKLPGGTGNFSVTLKTIGSQTITATDTITASLKGTTSITITLPPAPVVNAAQSQIGDVLNQPLSYTFTATGNSLQQPFTWSETGALPAGLAFASSGTLSGTPTQTGSFPISVTATDQFMQTSAAANFTIVVTVHGTIMQIRVTGQPVLVFDHTKDQQQSLNIPDIQITAWKEAGGTVNLMIPHYEAYRMRGPDLLHLTIDPTEIFSSAQSASQIPEDLYNYHHWLTGPYSSDGKTFYSLAHSEWYACLLNANDCNQVGANGLSATLNSWANTINSFVSTDGGATWQLNVVSGNHVVAKTAYVWTGSQPLADKVYLYAFNNTGIFQPTRLVKEGSFYYSIGWYLQRDFAQINPPTAYQAPVTSYGYVLMRTSDFTNPNGWAAWTGGTNYESLSSPTIETDISPFEPQQNGSSLNAAPGQIIFDTTAQSYILIFTLYGSNNNAVYYITTKSLANPAWSQATPILGTAQLITDPGGPGGGVQGFIDTNYPSILDNSSAGFNFEFTSGSPLLFWSTFPAQYGGDNLARDVYRVQLTTTYQ